VLQGRAAGTAPIGVGEAVGWRLPLLFGKRSPLEPLQHMELGVAAEEGPGHRATGGLIRVVDDKFWGRPGNTWGR
jgi:hypothetical protein